MNFFTTRFVEFFDIKQSYDKFTVHLSGLIQKLFYIQQELLSKNVLVLSKQLHQEEQQIPMFLTNEYNNQKQNSSYISSNSTDFVKSMLTEVNNFMDNELPFGIEYLSQIIDILVPISAF